MKNLALVIIIAAVGWFFFQAQIEAKKNGTAPVQRTTNRTRGY